MGIKLARAKKKKGLVRFFYLIDKLLPLGKKRKLRLYLNLEWIFDRFSHEYSFKNYAPDEHPVRTNTKDFLLRYILPEHHVLDLGCNRGDMAVYLAQHARMVVGVDYNPVPVNLAKQRYQQANLQFFCTDAYEYLNTTDIKFDVLILSHILEHLDNPGEFLNKYTPFFRYVYIELPDFDKSLLNHYRNKENLSLIYMDIDHVSEFDREELAALIAAANLEIIQAEYRFGIQKIWCKNKSN
jgi:SAM-dependent methyltransferase